MNHKRELTPAQAISRKQWLDEWESLRTWAMRCTIRYCRLRLAQYKQAQREEIRDDALGEAYRKIMSEPGLSARKAISQAVDNLTYELSRLNTIACQNEELGEMPEHSQQYETSQEQIDELLRSLPKHVRPLALLLSTGHYHHTESKRSAHGVYRGVPEIETTELSEILNRNKSNIKRQLQTLRNKLGSRFSYLLGDAMGTPVKSRVRP